MSVLSARHPALAGALIVSVTFLSGIAAPVSLSNASTTTGPLVASPPRGVMHDIPDVPRPAQPARKGGVELPEGIVEGSVGTLNGAIVVGDAGNVNWSTELFVIAGVGGMEPALRIGYGGSGYGALGVGFSLDMGSSVARCREVLGRDEHHAQIRWDADDRLCLDGVRLEVVSGTYGATNAEYRLSSGSQNVRVLALGKSVDAVSGFEVHTPDGRVTHYGAVPNQDWTHESIQWAQVGGGKVPFSWQIVRVVDRRSGNEMVYRYTGETMPGDGILTPADQRITSISYGINAQAGTTASRRVLFDYAHVQAVLAEQGHQGLEHEATPWVHQGYVSGQAYLRRQLLTRVRTEFKNELDEWQESRQYRLGYEGVPGLNPVALSRDQQSIPPEAEFIDQSSSADRVRLRALQECAPRPNDNQSGTHTCLWPTLFEWSVLSDHYLPMTEFGWDGEPFYPLPPAEDAENAPYFRIGAQVLADLDGDGDADMLVMPEPMNVNAQPGTTWDYWPTDEDTHTKSATNILTWSNQPWTNRAGTVIPSQGSVRNHYGMDSTRPPEPVRNGQFKDDKATPIAYALNYDGTGGEDVLIGEPVTELAGALMDPPWGLGSATIASMDGVPCPLFDLQKPDEFWPCMDAAREKVRSQADYRGHPGFMRELTIVNLQQAPTAANPTAQFKRTSLEYRDDRPILWVSPPLDMDGDGLDELMFCKANANYAAAAGLAMPMFYGANDTPVNWLTGTMHYVLNIPGEGISLRDGGIPVTDNTASHHAMRCHAKDTYLVLDVDGDGTQSLLHRLHPHAGVTELEQIAQVAPAEIIKDPFPKDGTFGKDELTAYWPKVWEKIYAEHALGDVYYSAFTLRPGVGMRHESTTLPFEQFMVWQQSGNTGRRYSTHQAAAATDADGGIAMADIWSGHRDGRWTDWGTPDSPMVGGPSDVRVGDVNGDGLQDVLMVDMQHCHWGQLGATDSQPPVFKERACSFQDAMEFGQELIEQTYEKLAVFTYLNRGDGSFELADGGARLWDTDLEPLERELLEGIYAGESNLEASIAFNAAWTKATLATRSWRMEFGHSFIGDGNADGLADLGYIRTALEPNGGWLGDSMAGRYRLYPVWRLGRHGGGLSHAETRMGLDLHDIVPVAKNKGWPGFDASDKNNVFWGDADSSVATVDMYEQQGYGLAGRLLPIDVNRDGRPELAFYDHVRGAYRLATPKKTSQPQPHLLTAVVNGFEARTEVDYAPQWTLTHPDSAFTPEDIHLPYPLYRRPSAAPAAAMLREDTGQDFGDGPAYRFTNYLYGKTLLDVRRGITLGMDRSYQQQSVATPSGTMFRRRMVRYSNNATYSEVFKAYPLAGSMLSETVKIWGSDDETVRISHAGQRSSAQAGKVAPTWRRQLESSTASTYELGQDVPTGGVDQLFDCLVNAYDGPVDCALGDEDSYQPLSHSRTSLAYDADYGLLKTQIVEAGGTTAVTQTEFEHRDPPSLDTPVPYVLGLPATEWTAHEPSPGDGYVLRTSSNIHDAVGRLLSTTLEPDRSQYRFTTSYAYDDFGHVTTSTVSAAGLPDSTTTQSYGVSGAYPTMTTDALGHTTTTRWYEGCGLPEQVTSPLGHTQVDDIDPFCRSKERQLFHGDVALTRPTKTFHIETFLPAFGREMKIFTFVGDDYQGEDIRSQTIVNRVGQTIESRAPAFGFETYTLTHYDALGRVSEVSLPTRVGEKPAGWTTTTYDGQSRIVGLTKPDDTQQTTHYQRDSGDPQHYVTTVIDELGNSGASVTNSLGQVVKVIPPIDPELPDVDLSMCYSYGAFGTLVEAAPCVKNATKGSTTLSYDDYGRLTKSQDNQAGIRRTRYDALGRVHESEDALGQITRMQYDILGRLVGRTEAFGTPEAKTAVWSYDDLAPGILTHAINADSTVIEQPLLDEHNRVVGGVTTIHGRSYTRRHSIDAWGRVASQSYPSLSLLAPVITYRQYNELDQPTALTYQGQTLWEPIEADVWGLTKQRLGQGVLTARTGRDLLTGRLHDAQVSRRVIVNEQPEDVLLEHFTYDWYDHGLLRQRTQHALTQQNNDQSDQFQYNARGELRNWTTIGANHAIKQGLMRYDGFGNITSSPSGDYTYFDEKLLTIQGPMGLLSYTYDDNGRVISRNHPGGETLIDYDALNQVSQIKSPMTTLTLTYSADGAKVHAEDKATGRQTFYLGAYQEERGGDLAEKGQVIGRYAFGPAHLTRVWNEADPGYTDTLTYMPPADHLGSATLLTDAIGLPTERRSYDIWGTERDNGNWATFKAAPAHDLTNPVTGFTGHHERKQFGTTAPGISGLIDMKARYYDPTAMRFMQPDTIIPNVFNPTDWNRLAYVNNSPVNFSDPTGQAAQAQSSKADPTLDVSRLAYDFYVGAMSALDGYARANGLPTGVAASTIGHPFSGAHEETMAATRGRQKPGGAQNAERRTPLSLKSVDQMTSEEKFFYMSYMRDVNNYKAANMKAPFNNVDEYIVWRNASVEAQAMGVSSAVMERMAENTEIGSGLITGPVLMHRTATKAASAAKGTQVSPFADDLAEFSDAANDGIYAPRIARITAIGTDVGASLKRTDLIAQLDDGTSAKIGTLRADPKSMMLTAEIEGRFASSVNLDSIMARLQPYSEVMSTRIIFRFPAALPDSIESMAGFDLPGMPFYRSFFGAADAPESIVYNGYVMDFITGTKYNRVDFYHPTLWIPPEPK